MMSPTHTLMALAILSQARKPKRNWAVLIGSVIPDAFIWISSIWLLGVKGVSGERMWNEIYFEPPMQLTASIFNSVPLYCGLALLGWTLRTLIWGKWLMLFAIAALIHIAFDFPVHNHDAYAHFWPFSDWRFVSPFSYYELDHHANIVGLIEGLIAAITGTILWKRFPQQWVQVTLLLLAMFYGAVIISRFLPPEMFGG